MLAGKDCFSATLALPVLAVGLLFGSQNIAANQAPLNCSSAESWREFHVSADPIRRDLRPVDVIGAPGGEGTLGGMVAQQANPDGGAIIQISADGSLEADGVQAELIAVDLQLGTMSFSACTNSGFLVLALYSDDAGQIVGAPADVLSATNSVNFANVTDKSDQRIGVRFNAGGAEDALEIVQAALRNIQPGLPFTDRRVAEDILVNNITDIFDVSESQAPVFSFQEDYCSIQDRFVISTDRSSCTGVVNPAVNDVLDSTGEGVLDKLSGAIVVQPDQVYYAQIGEGEDLRIVIFATAYVPEPVVVEELKYTLQSCSFFGCNSASLPFSASSTTNLSITPRPTWFDLQEYQLSIQSGTFTVSNVEARIISGPATQARILGLEERAYTAGESITIKIQSGRSTSSSQIEFAFDVDGIPGSPATFFLRATVQTN